MTTNICILNKSLVLLELFKLINLTGKNSRLEVFHIENVMKDFAKFKVQSKAPAMEYFFLKFLDVDLQLNYKRDSFTGVFL